MNFFEVCKIRLLACATLLAAPLAAHAQNPLYSPESALLYIPSIDTEARLPFPSLIEARHGGYHDARLEFVQGDLWRLKQYTPATEIPGVEKVRVVKTDSFPVQVFLEVEGVIGYTCARLRLEKRLHGRTFYISIQEERASPFAACIASAANFSWIVPLEVYGLGSGEYTYLVNHGIGPVEYQSGGGSVNRGVGLSGSFTLEVNNVFPRTAPEFPGFIHPEVTQVTPR